MSNEAFQSEIGFKKKGLICSLFISGNVNLRSAVEK